MNGNRHFSLLSRICLVLCVGLAGCGRFSDPVSSDAKASMAEITKGIQDTYGGQVCVREGPFPIRVTPDMRSAPVCLYCSTLEKAGLVEKVNPDNDGNPRNYAIQLTAKGEEYYSEQVPKRDGSGETPGFCFGTAALEKVDAALPRLKIPGKDAISVKYRMRVSNPGKFLFEPASKALGFPYLPLNPDGVSKPLITTVTFYNGKFLELDDSFRYGAWLNE